MLDRLRAKRRYYEESILEYQRQIIALQGAVQALTELESELYPDAKDALTLGELAQAIGAQSVDVAKGDPNATP